MYVVFSITITASFASKKYCDVVSADEICYYARICKKIPGNSLLHVCEYSNVP
jgi:hypothetical protein